jgi:hypothetical protein
VVLALDPDARIPLARASARLAHADLGAAPGRLTPPRDPALSVVATTRNDDHGGNQLARTQIFIDGLAEQSDRFELPIELVLVEWNPPPDRPSLSEALSWPQAGWLQPRILVVPPDVHGRLRHAEALPLFQFIAKNVGIRRATAGFVLATNIDILFSDELFTWFAHGPKPGVLYRVDRLDVVADLAQRTLPSPAQVRMLPWIRANRPDGPEYADGRRPRWYARGRQRFNRAAWDILHGGPLPRLHTWACGDFTLTGRDVWQSLRGYPEWQMFSMYLDSLLLVQAYRAGVAMVNLEPPLVVYHMEHGAGSGWTPEGARTLATRLEAAGVEYLRGGSYDRLARQVLRQPKGFHAFNDEGWGLSGEVLAEAVPHGRATSSSSEARPQSGPLNG